MCFLDFLAGQLLVGPLDTKHWTVSQCLNCPADAFFVSTVCKVSRNGPIRPHDQIEARAGFSLYATRLSHSYKITNEAAAVSRVNRLHHLMALQHLGIFFVTPVILLPLSFGERIQSAP